MPIQASSILKNTGPKQDLKYWMWTDLASSRKLIQHPNKKEAFVLTDSTISKIGSDGRFAWTRSSYVNTTRDIAVDTSGNVYTLTQNGTVIKYNSSGSVVWGRTLSSSGVAPDAYQLSIGASNSVYIACRHSGDGTLIKLSADGSFLWARKVVDLDFGEDVVVDEANNRVYFAGGYGSNRGYVSAFDVNGTAQWQRDLYSGSMGFINSLSAHSGQLFVTWLGSFNNGLILIFAYNTSGTLLFPFGGSASFVSTGNFAAVRAKTNLETGETAIIHPDGTIRKYSNSWGLVSSARLPDPPFGASYPDIDNSGDMYFHALTTVAKIKGDMSGSGIYGSVSLGSAAASTAFSPDNSYQSFNTTASLSITSITFTSTAIPSSPVFTSTPSANFISIRTK